MIEKDFYFDLQEINKKDSKFIMSHWLGILFFLLGFLAGALIMFFLFKRYLTKNPPITEKQIKLMFKQMGRNPGEKQIKQIMTNIKNQK